MQTSWRTRPGNLVDVCPKCGHVLPDSHRDRKPKISDDDFKANALLGAVFGSFAFCVAMGIGFNIWLSLAVLMGAGYLVFDHFTKQDLAKASQRNRRG